MIIGTIRCCSQARCLHSVVALTRNGLVGAAAEFGGSRNYSKDEGSCCKDVAQTHGMKVEPWPKSDPPPPAWRPQCPCEPQPPNYDPYRIKVPDIVCPPLPPSNAKWTAVLRASQPGQHGDQGQQQEYGHYPNYGHPQNAQSNEEQSQEEPPPSAGFFGFLKGLFRGKGRPKGKEEVSMDFISSHELFQTPSAQFARTNFDPMLDLLTNSPVLHPDYWKDAKKLPLAPNDIQDSLPRLGYHGKIKYKYAFHEPWKPLDRLTLLSQAEKEEIEATHEELRITEEVAETEKC